MAIQQGSIVWVKAVFDPNRRNPKDRPVVVLTPTNEITETVTLVGAVATSVIPRSLSAKHVRLKWSHGRHPMTGLFKDTVVLCDWLHRFSRTDILDVGGFCGSIELAEIIDRLNG